MMSTAELIERYMDAFCHVRSDFAVQQPDGRYFRAREPLTSLDVHGHLAGERTLGYYLLDGHDRVAVGVLDHDDVRLLARPGAPPERRPEDGMGHLQDARERLARVGVEAALEQSRRGGHLWVFAREPVPAADMRALLFLAMGPAERERWAQGQRAFEVYPKQDRRGQGVGSSIRGPFGVHAKSGERYPFVDADGLPCGRSLSSQIGYIAGVERADVARVLEPYRPEILASRVLEHVNERAQQVVQARTVAPLRHGAREGGGQGRIAAWVQSVDCRAVVEFYGVTLNHQGVGTCPFHDDHVASFQVGRNNRWYCYAEGRGGNAFDFVQEKEGLTPRDTLRLVSERWPLADWSHTQTPTQAQDRSGTRY